jgi:hypothetical protein
MIRVRACTIRCRCHNNCRRSRFSQLGTQTWGNRFSSSKRRISCASCRSVFCLRTRLVRISAASPIHSSNPNSPSSRSNQRAARSPPSLREPSLPGRRDHGRTSPLPRGAPAVALAVPQSHHLQQRFVESPAVAELERNLIIERVRAGLRRARLEGRVLGRKPIDIDRVGLLRDRARGLSLAQLAKTYKISRTSVARTLKRSESAVLKPSLPVDPVLAEAFQSS